MSPSALERTFQLSSGVGPWREKDLWARGISRWGEFQDYVRGGSVLMSKKLDATTMERIELAQTALAEGDLPALARMVPPREHWRLYTEPRFAEFAAFFDIEADAENQLTVVSVMDGEGLGTFISGRNLGDLEARLGQSAIWVTFNGSVFDVPVLKQHFPRLVDAPVHIDLRFLSGKVGLKGGLKEIEEQLGLARPPHLKGVRGMDAIRLWREYKINKLTQGLRFLVEYNLYDSINLRAVLEQSINLASERLGWNVPRQPTFERGDVLYDLSKLLLTIQ